MAGLADSGGLRHPDRRPLPMDSDPMIDNPEQTERLLNEIESALPLMAMVTPELAASLRLQSPGIDVPRRCMIRSLLYTGEDGGIMCEIDLGTGDRKNVFLASLTHLAFDPREKLTRSIVAYQKHRVKGLRRLGTPKSTVVSEYGR